jgi:hypothetical protein
MCLPQRDGSDAHHNLPRLTRLHSARPTFRATIGHRSRPAIEEIDDVAPDRFAGFAGRRPLGPTLTIVMTLPNGKSWLMATGEGWEQVAPKAGPGLGAKPRRPRRPRAGRSDGSPVKVKAMSKMQELTISRVLWIFIDLTQNVMHFTSPAPKAR